MLTTTRVVNLTLPISPYVPVGATFPWESPYFTEDIATIERNGAHLSYISMGSGTGTRLRAPSFARQGARTTGNVDLAVLVNRAAAVLHIPKAASEPIEDAEIDAALAHAVPQRGEASSSRRDGARRTAGRRSESAMRSRARISPRPLPHVCAM
jgi:kynurenine formamidase